MDLHGCSKELERIRSDERSEIICVRSTMVIEDFCGDPLDYLRWLEKKPLNFLIQTIFHVPILVVR